MNVLMNLSGDVLKDFVMTVLISRNFPNWDSSINFFFSWHGFHKQLITARKLVKHEHIT